MLPVTVLVAVGVQLSVLLGFCFVVLSLLSLLGRAAQWRPTQVGEGSDSVAPFPAWLGRPGGPGPLSPSAGVTSLVTTVVGESAPPLRWGVGGFGLQAQVSASALVMPMVAQAFICL